MYKKLQSWLHSAFFWYWLYAFATFFIWKYAGFLILEEAPDSGTYIFKGSFLDALSSVRTLGYPLFLKFVSWWSPEFAELPELQFFLHAFSVFVLLRGLYSIGLSKIQCLIATAPLLYLEFARIYIPYQLTESLAVAFAITSIGLLLILIDKPRNLFIWLALLASVFCAYQVRPAFLFLVPTIPFIGIALTIIRGTAWRNRLRFFSYLIITTVTPLILFSALRLTLVGHFGLVSFGGFNVVGISSQMLTQENIKFLPSYDRDLGASIVDRRLEDREILSSPKDYPADLPIISNNVALACTKPLPMNYRDWVLCYNYHIWLLSVPLASEQYSTTVEVNRALKSLSKNTILNNSGLYLTWLYRAFLDAIYWTPRIDPILMVASVLLSLLFLAEIAFLMLRTTLMKSFNRKVRLFLLAFTSLVSVLLVAAFLKFDSFAVLLINVFFTYSFTFNFICSISLFLVAANPRISAYFNRTFLISLPLFAISSLYFLSGVLLVIAVEPPISRYLMPLHIFFPGLFFLQSYLLILPRLQEFRIWLSRELPNLGI